MNDHKKRVLKAKIALSLRDTLNRQPTINEVEKYYIAAQVLWKVVAGAKAMRSNMKRRQQLAIF